MKRKGICMVCGCTEAEACHSDESDERCGWANVKMTLCTSCVNLTDEQRAEKQETNLADLAERVELLHLERQELCLRMDVIRANRKPVKKAKAVKA